MGRLKDIRFLKKAVLGLMLLNFFMYTYILNRGPFIDPDKVVNEVFVSSELKDGPVLSYLHVQDSIKHYHFFAPKYETKKILISDLEKEVSSSDTSLPWTSSFRFEDLNANLTFKYNCITFPKEDSSFISNIKYAFRKYCEYKLKFMKS